MKMFKICFNSTCVGCFIDVNSFCFRNVGNFQYFSELTIIGSDGKCKFSWKSNAHMSNSMQYNWQIDWFVRLVITQINLLIHDNGRMGAISYYMSLVLFGIHLLLFTFNFNF